MTQEEMKLKCLEFATELKLADPLYNARKFFEWVIINENPFLTEAQRKVWQELPADFKFHYPSDTKDKNIKA